MKNEKKKRAAPLTLYNSIKTITCMAVILLSLIIRTKINYPTYVYLATARTGAFCSQTGLSTDPAPLPPPIN